MTEAVIRVEALAKHFGKLEVLKNISTQIRRGEVVAVLGPSGSGKSTFLRCVNLLERPTKGKIFFNDRDITAPKVDALKVRQNMVMVFQHFNLFPHMTVLQNVTYAPIKVKKGDRKQVEQMAMELLGKVGLAEKADVYPSHLSGGQKQRVAIARALAMQPEVLLFDEPTSALDPEMVSDVLNVMSDLAKTGITMAIVTHEMGFARNVANRILFLDQGCLAEDAAPNDFFNNPQCARAQQFLEKML
ncbi:MAG TPA: amino acid ABC transporter ATP-binding protein [Thermosynechococcaceae cyanobacterium]